MMAVLAVHKFVRPLASAVCWYGKWPPGVGGRTISPRMLLLCILNIRALLQYASFVRCP